MTRGYIDYSIDIEGGVIGEPNIHPVVPGYIPQEKEEEIKWKIRKEQEPLFKLIKDTKEERQNILHIIQNYTINPQIEREWAVIDVALSLLPMEDRFISGLWMRHEALDKNLRTVAEWNQYIHTSKGKHESDKFIKRSPMAFRAYFFQYFIRKHFNKMTRLILVEQTGGDSYVPVWLKFPSPKDIPVVSKEASINAILEEHDSFRKEYLSEIERRSIGIHTF
ncbi:MAG: hypothetical protein A2X29_09680 [Elusimicrobia bacterium GWA2_64_40]|nr:MAG: hypothetical protein A2X29_09680 [Elusimicrobia bacterium GWA2_64_40]